MADDDQFAFSTSSHTDNDPSGGATSGPESLSQTEQDVLDEYARLLGNLNKLSSILASLAQNPSADILDGLRGLERKTATVFTLLKASVYSIVLQQQYLNEETGSGGQQQQQGLGDRSVLQ